jgi:NAD+ kinase
VGAGLPVLGVNSSPSTSVGYFCSLSKDRCGAALRAALRGRVRAIDLTRMQVRVGSRLVFKRVLNDALFCHASPAATSRYIVQLDGAVEVHKSSGFWVGPAAGSTAAQRSAGGRVLALGSDALQLVVREPFTFTGRLRFARTLVPAGHEIVVVSKMTEGRLFIDGPQLVHEVRLGERISFARSDEPLRVLGISARHRRPV